MLQQQYMCVSYALFLSLAYKAPFKYHGEKGKHSI